MLGHCAISPLHDSDPQKGARQPDPPHFSTIPLGTPQMPGERQASYRQLLPSEPHRNITIPTTIRSPILIQPTPSPSRLLHTKHPAPSNLPYPAYPNNPIYTTRQALSPAPADNPVKAAGRLSNSRL